MIPLSVLDKGLSRGDRCVAGSERKEIPSLPSPAQGGDLGPWSCSSSCGRGGEGLGLPALLLWVVLNWTDLCRNPKQESSSVW